MFKFDHKQRFFSTALLITVSTMVPVLSFLPFDDDDNDHDDDNDDDHDVDESDDKDDDYS